MKKLTSLGLCALAAPALTLGISSALAQESLTAPERAQEQRTTTQQATQAERTTAERAAQEQRAAAERAEQLRETGEHAEQRVAQVDHLSSQPANTLLAGDLIGSNLKSSADQDLGSISDFIVDDDGQIVAVIVGVGGFLGVGERDVAVSWDSMKRTMNEDGDGYVFQANMTDSALRNAPEYK